MIRVFEVGGANRYDYNDTTPAYIFPSCPTKDLNVCRNKQTFAGEDDIFHDLQIVPIYLFLENKSPFVEEDLGSRNVKISI